MSFRSLFLEAKQNNFSASAVIRSFRFPLGRNSIPSALTKKLDPDIVSLIDDRPISLRFRVSTLMEFSELDKAAQISRLAVLKQYRGWDTTVLMCNEIIGAMSAAKRYDDAIALFHYFFNENHDQPDLNPDIVSFNHIIKALCEESVDEALQLYLRSSITVLPNMDTLRLLTKGLVDDGRIYDAVSFVKARKVWDSVVYSYLIRGFLDLGNHDKAYELFYEFHHKTVPDCDGRSRVMIMPDRTDGQSRKVIVDATFLDYWFKQGEDEKAMETYRSLISKKDELLCAATGNTLLRILLDNGKHTEAWDLFNAMVSKFKTFDRDTFREMVNACFKLGHFKEALDTFKRPELTRSSRCYANIITQFCERGMMSEAQDLFEEICSDKYLCPDVPTFRSMINGYAKAGRVNEAIEMLKKMVDATLLKVAVHEAH